MARKTICVIGLGSIGLRHAKNLIMLGHKVYGIDPIVERERACVEAGGSELPIGGDMREECDGIVIASPTALHYQEVINAYMVNPGAKLFVEKPIAHKFVNLSTLHNVAMVGNNLRFHSVVKKAKEWMPDLGKPQWAEFYCCQHNERSDYHRDGVTMNWGAHEVDLAQYLLGSGKVVSAYITENDSVSNSILDLGGCRTYVNLDYHTRPELRGFKIIADGKRIFGDLVARKIHFDGGDNDQRAFWGGDSFDQNYIEEMQAFIDRISGEETLGATAEDGLNTIALCLKIKEMGGL